MEVCNADHKAPNEERLITIHQSHEERDYIEWSEGLVFLTGNSLSRHFRFISLVIITAIFYSVLRFILCIKSNSIMLRKLK